MKSKKDLYIYNSDSLIKLAEIEGSEWLEIQRKEFYKILPIFGSFSYALDRYKETKHIYDESVRIAIINGQIHKYEVLGNGLIKNESEIFS